MSLVAGGPTGGPTAAGSYSPQIGSVQGGRMIGGAYSGINGTQFAGGPNPTQGLSDLANPIGPNGNGGINPMQPNGTRLYSNANMGGGQFPAGGYQGAGPQQFNAQAYLAANPDVAAAGVDPLQHWNEFGQKEGRTGAYDRMQPSNQSNTNAAANFAAQQYGLAGAEDALRQGAMTSINAIGGGAAAAGSAIQQGSQNALGRLGQAQGMIGSGVNQGIGAIGGAAGRAQGMVAGGTRGGMNALQAGTAGAQDKLNQAGSIIGSSVNQNVRGLQQGGAAAQNYLAQGGMNAQGQINQGIGALQQGAQQGQQILKSLFDQAVDPITGFIDPGQKAQILQASMTGALGPEAQREAIRNFSGDPAAAFALEEAERATLRNASAIGGLGGGRVRQELQRQAQGIQNQQFNTRVDQLGGQAALGLNAAQTAGQLRGQQGQLSSNLAAQTGRDIAGMRQIGAGMAQDLGGAQANIARGTSQDVASILESGGVAQAGLAEQSALLQQQTGQNMAELIRSGAVTRADIETGAGNSIAELIQSGSMAGADLETIAAQVEQSTGQNLAEVAQNTGINIANIAQDLGSNSAELRSQAGRDLAAAIADSSSQLAQLQSDQGAGLSNIAGKTGAALADALLKEGLLDADSARQLGTLLANISVEGATSQAQLAQNVGAYEAAGVVGMSNAAQSAIGGLAEAYAKRQASTRPAQAPASTSGTSRIGIT